MSNGKEVMQVGALNSLEELKKQSIAADSQSELENNQVESLVSFHAEIPLALQLAMRSFIERYPNWDQYRLVKAALSGFLVQNGVESRAITRMYIGNMFGNESFTKDF